MSAHSMLSDSVNLFRNSEVKWLNQILSNNIADAVRALHKKKRDINRERRFSAGRNSAGGLEDWLPSDQTTPSHCAI